MSVFATLLAGLVTLLMMFVLSWVPILSEPASKQESYQAADILPAFLFHFHGSWHGAWLDVLDLEWLVNFRAGVLWWSLLPMCHHLPLRDCVYHLLWWSSLPMYHLCIICCGGCAVCQTVFLVSPVPKLICSRLSEVSYERASLKSTPWAYSDLHKVAALAIVFAKMSLANIWVQVFWRSNRALVF